MDLSPHDLATAHTIILRTYPTWAQRTLNVIVENRVVPSDEDHDLDPEMDLKSDIADRESRIRRIFSSHFESRFSRVICDEAHALKIPRTQTHPFPTVPRIAQCSDDDEMSNGNRNQVSDKNSNDEENPTGISCILQQISSS